MPPQAAALDPDPTTATAPPPKITMGELGARVREKYPVYRQGEWKDLSNDEIAKRVMTSRRDTLPFVDARRSTSRWRCVSPRRCGSASEAASRG